MLLIEPSHRHAAVVPTAPSHLVQSQFFRARIYLVVLGALLALPIFWSSFEKLIWLSMNSDHYTHIIFVPFVSAALIFSRRHRIFGRASQSWYPSAAAFIFAGACFIFAKVPALTVPAPFQLSLMILSALALLWAAFLICFGVQAFRAAMFPLLFLLLIVPFPEPWVNGLVHILQVASADVADIVFRIAGMPVTRYGGSRFVFPGLAIEVATECSGIRSFISFLIGGLLSAHLFLRSPWKKAVWCLLLAPLAAVVKNGFRIAALAMYAEYVDKNILSTWVHTEGGVIFSFFTILIFAPILGLLARSEQQISRPPARVYPIQHH